MTNYFTSIFAVLNHSVIKEKNTFFELSGNFSIQLLNDFMKSSYIMKNYIRFPDKVYDVTNVAKC